MSWRCEERGHQQIQNWPFSPDIFKSQQQWRFQRVFLLYFQGECKCGLATFCTPTDIRSLLFHGWKGSKRHSMSYKLTIWYQYYHHWSLRDIYWHILSTINTCLSLRYRPKEWLISSILSFALFAYDLHVCKLWNTARWQEPAFDKASDLRVINLWSWYETLQNQAQGNINSLMVKYVQVWNRIFPKKYLVDGLALGHGMHNPEYH